METKGTELNEAVLQGIHEEISRYVATRFDTRLIKDLLESINCDIREMEKRTPSYSLMTQANFIFSDVRPRH